MSIYGKKPIINEGPKDQPKDDLEDSKVKSVSDTAKSIASKNKVVDNVYTEQGELLGYYLSNGTIKLLDGTIIPKEQIEEQ